MASVRHLGFFKIDFLRRFRGPTCSSVQNFVGIGQTIAEIFQDGGRPPFWICGTNLGLPTLQNLVAIPLVVLIVQKFEYFVCLA